MKLREYLFRTETKLTEFAKQIGITRPYLSLIVLGSKKPSPKLAKKIIEATNGHVTLSELMFPEDYPQQPLENLHKSP